MSFNGAPRSYDRYPITLASLSDTETIYDPAELESTYSGRWINTTYDTTGEAAIIVTAIPVDQQLAVTVDMDGSVFGGSGSPAETIHAPYGPAGIHLGTVSDTFGELTVDISSQGLVTGTGNLTDPYIDQVRFIRAVTPGSIVLQYTVTLVSNGTAVGVLILMREVGG